MKIDTSKIEGYAEMSDADKLKAIEEFDFAVDDTESVAKLKKELSKVNSEAAGYKKELREKMSAEQKAEEDRKEREQYYANIEKENKQYKYLAALSGAGFSTENAKSAAEAFSEGDTDKLFEILKKHNEDYKSSIIAEITKDTYHPDKDYDDKGKKDEVSEEEKLGTELGDKASKSRLVDTERLNKFIKN